MHFREGNAAVGVATRTPRRSSFTTTAEGIKVFAPGRITDAKGIIVADQGVL